MRRNSHESGAGQQDKPTAAEIFDQLNGKTVKMIDLESGKTETQQVTGITTRPEAGVLLKKRKNGESSASTKIIPLDEFYKLREPANQRHK